MNKISYAIGIFIILATAVAGYVLGSGSTPSGYAGAAYGAAIIMILLIILFPLTSLAYLFNWQHLFRQSQAITKWQVFKAAFFFLIAALIAIAWGAESWNRNSLEFLLIVSALPILLFGVINIVSYFRSNSYEITRKRKIELACFIIPALLVAGFITAYAYKSHWFEIAKKESELHECNQKLAERAQHQIDSQMNAIAKNAYLENMNYYKRLPKRHFELFLYMLDTEEVLERNEYNEYFKEYYKEHNKRFNLPNAPWTLEIISRLDDPKPQIILTGKSDNKGFIQANLANYPEVRVALQKGRSLRITTAQGSAILEGRKINSGELVLSGISGTFLDAHPAYSCPDTHK
jgi:hypothetical protein